VSVSDRVFHAGGLGFFLRQDVLEHVRGTFDPFSADPVERERAGHDRADQRVDLGQSRFAGGVVITQY
jgi:hypothetical protein